MVDAMIILAGAMIGLISARLLLFLSALFGKTSSDHGAYGLGALIGILTLLACFALLGAHWGGPPLTPHYNWEYTPPLVFLSCLGVFIACLVLNWRQAQELPKHAVGVLSRRKHLFYRNVAALGLFAILMLVFALHFVAYIRR